MKKGGTKMAQSTIDYLLVPSKNFSDILHFSIDDKMPESDHCSLSFMFNICITPVFDNVDSSVYQSYSKYKWDATKVDCLRKNLFDQQGISYIEYQGLMPK